MQILPVDRTGRLFQVRDLLPLEQVKEIQQIDWLSLSWERNVPGWPRRKIQQSNPEILLLDQRINDLVPEINHLLNTNFRTADGAWWLDEPGFTVGIHTDGQLPAAMQIYWIIPGAEYGTGFYLYKNCSEVQHQFLSVPNTGYLMLNHPGDHGEQPLLWHGMLNPVPEHTIRLSSYWYFFQ